MPPRLKIGDRVRFVSPVSPPEPDAVFARVKILESWGLDVDFGEHVFHKHGYLAGTDEQRLTDFNTALRDPGIRAIFATRGGKGSYRIADQLDFHAARLDPKFIIGFSDITALHLSLYKHAGLIGVHGALIANDGGEITDSSMQSLQRALMSSDDIVIRSSREEPTAVLTTEGVAEGRMIGGNLEMVATAAGWALPDIRDAILLLEAVNMGLGQVDRQLTMLAKGSHLAGLAGIALGQFSGFKPHGSFTIVDLLRDHLASLNIPILGGLSLGHEVSAVSVLVGAKTTIDARSGKLTVSR